MGLPSKTVKVTLNSRFPRTLSLAQIVKLVVVMFHVGVPEIIPVSGSSDSPSGSAGDISQLSMYSSPAP